MNRVFKLFWSRRLGMLVPVAEGLRSVGRNGQTLSRRGRRRRALRLAERSAALAPIRASRRSLIAPALGVALTTLVSGAVVHAAVLPKGGTVVAGSAAIAFSGAGATITQTSQRAIIDWNRFSISPGAWVQFIQPNASSAILNRVTGGDPSQIYGEIKANGQVFVINPNGVVVGPTGVIQAGTFVASTLETSNAMFMSGGTVDFNGSSAAPVQNFGFIQATDGDVVLIGRTIDNAATLQAAQGDVALAAGSDVLLQPSSDARVVVQAGLPTGGTGIDNAGEIKAAQVEILAAGGNAYALAVNAGGTIEAVGVVQKEGRVVLTADGGDVQVTGQVSARNADGSGGRIEVGGGSRGQDPSVADAANVTIAASATLDANAAARGNGGQVTVWSNQKTLFAGRITATGGTEAGNGGQVEVSGGYEDFIGQVVTLAPHGAIGSLLLDPDSAIIDTNPTAASGTLAGGNLTGSLSGSTTVYSASQIETLLVGNDVTVVTNTNVVGGTGNITIEDTSGQNNTFALSNFTGNLLIEAANNLNIQVPLTISSIAPNIAPNAQTTGTVTFQAGQNISVSAPLSMSVAATGVDGGSNATATLGAVSFLATNGAITFSSSAPISLVAAAQGGNVTLTGSGISVSANAGGSADVAFNGLTLQAGNGLSLAAAIGVSLTATGGSSASGYHTNSVNGGAATITPGLINLEAGSGALNLSAPLSVTSTATGGVGADVSNDGYANVGAGGTATVGPWPSAAPWTSSGVAWSPGIAFSGASISLTTGTGGATGAVSVSATATGGAGGGAGYDDTLSTVAGGPGGGAVADAPGVNFDSLGAFRFVSLASLSSALTASAGALGTAYQGVQAFGGPASATAGDINVTAASAILAGAISFTGAASDANANLSGVGPGGSVGVGNLNVSASAGDITLAGTITSSATYDAAPIGAVLSPLGNFLFSGGSFVLGTSGDILSNISQNLAAFAGVAASTGAASLSGMNDITLTAGDSVLMPGAALALPNLSTQTKLVIVADTANTAGQPGGVTGAIDLLGATLPLISATSNLRGPNVSIWGVDNSLMNLGDNYPAAARGVYLGNLIYAAGDWAPGVHCRAAACSAPALTITAANVTGQYGTALPTFTASDSGLVYGDGGVGSANDNIAGPQFVTSYSLAGAQLTPNVGLYTLTPTAVTAPSYYGIVNYVSGALTITAAPLSLTANNASMTYGGAAPTLGDTILGLVNGDTAAALGPLHVALAQAINAPAGTYDGVITVSGAVDPNYQISYVAGALNINPAPLLITPNNAAMTYGGTLPGFTVSYGTVVNGVVQDGLVNQDNGTAIASLAVTTAASSHSNAGSYAISASGASDPNYVISYAPGTLTINPAPLTITANSAAMTYGGLTPAFTASFVGLVNNDTSSVIQNLGFSSAGGSTARVGSYAIVASGGTDANYAFTYVPGTLTINPAPLTLTANNASMTYGGAAPTLGDTILGLVNGDTAAALGTLSLANAQAITANAGTYNGVITVSGALDPNYQISYVAGALTINPAPLLITPNTAAMTYGGTVPGFTASYGTVVNGVVQDGLVNQDTAAVIASLALATAATSHSNAGAYAISASGASDPNYAISYAPGTLTINPAPLTITASALKDYGRPATTYSANFTGLVNGDTAAALGSLAYTIAVRPQAPVGTYANAVLASGAADANYAITYVPGPLTIAPFGTLTITANASTIDFGSALPNFTATYGGLFPGDTPGVVTGLKFATTATLGANVGTYQIIPYGASAPTYYTLTYADGVLTIAPAPVTVTANNAAMTYGGALMPSLGVTVAGLVEGNTNAQVVSADPTTTAHLGANAGTYAIVPNATLLDPNYQLIQVNGVFTVNPAPLTITANNAAMTYGGLTPAFTASFAGLVNGDTSSAIGGLGFSSLGGSTANTGTYAIIPSGGADANYAITYAPGTLIINPALLTITADNASMTYGGAAPTLGDTISGLVNGDTATALGTLTLANAQAITSNAGTYNAVTTVSGAFDPNYQIRYVAGALTINPAPLVITANNAATTYGGTLPSLTASYGTVVNGVVQDGLVNGDTTGAITSLGLTTAATAHSNAGTYAVTASSANDPNYAISYVPGTLTINPAPLTITVDNAAMTYGGLTPAFAASFAGLVNGDTSSVIRNLAFSSLGGSTANAGSYAIVASGGTDSNYAFTYAPGTLTIDPASLTITADNAAMTFGAATPTLVDSVAGLVNGDRLANVVALAPATTATSTSNAGAYFIVPGAQVLSQNYTLALTDGTLTINPATLTLTLDSASVTRGDTPQACTSGCGAGVAVGTVGSGTSVYASQYTDPATSDTLVWTATGFAGGDNAFSGAPSLKGDGVTTAYAFVQGGFSVSKNYVVDLVQPVGAAWLTVANPPLVVTTDPIYVIAQNPMQPPAYAFSGLRGSDISLNGQDLSSNQFSYTTNAQLSNTAGGDYQVTPAGPSLYYPVPGDPYGPYSVTYQPGLVQVLPTADPPPSTTSTTPTPVTRTISSSSTVTGVTAFGPSPSALAYPGVSNTFGIPVAFGLQIDTVVGQYLQSQNAPHDQRAINNWIAANGGSASATGDIEPFIIKYLSEVEAYQTASPAQQAQIVSEIGHVPSPSDYQLDTMVCTQLQAARTQAAEKANADYQNWLNQQSALNNSNRTLTSLFGQLVAPPTYILAEAEAGISPPTDVSVATLASVAAGAGAAGATVGVLTTASAAMVSNISYGLAYGIRGVTQGVAAGAELSTDIIAGASAGPLIAVTVAASIAIQGIIATVEAQEFPGKLAAATQQAETYQTITQLMGGTASQAGMTTDLAGILAAGLPGGTMQPIVQARPSGNGT